MYVCAHATHAKSVRNVARNEWCHRCWWVMLALAVVCLWLWLRLSVAVVVGPFVLWPGWSIAIESCDETKNWTLLPFVRVVTAQMIESVTMCAHMCVYLFVFLSLLNIYCFSICWILHQCAIEHWRRCVLLLLSCCALLLLLCVVLIVVCCSQAIADFWAECLGKACFHSCNIGPQRTVQLSKL